MSGFEEMNRFLEERLEEFLKSHPGLELQVLDEQVREQESKIKATLRQLTTEEQSKQQDILKTAQEVQRWNERITKAEQAKRPDLAAAAREREAALLRQGNQQWAQMTLLQQNIQQTKAIAAQLQSRRQDIQAKIRQDQTTPHRPPTPQSWQNTPAQSWPSSGSDPLEQKFKNWEMEEELAALKRKMGQ